MRALDPSQLEALSAILRSGSFDGAAAALGVTPSAISQRIKALEEQVGAPVVVRDTPCRATALGQRLARHADQVALLTAQLAKDIGAAAAPTRLRIAVNADSLDTWFVQALSQIDGILFDLEVDDQDHSDSWLRDGAVSAAITSRAQPVRGCTCYPLGGLPYVATASPAFVDRWFSTGLTAAAFNAAPMLEYSQKDRLQIDWAEQLTGQSLHPPRHRIPSTHGFVEAAIGGLGWGLNPQVLVAAPLAEGVLVALSDTSVLTPLYWQVPRTTQAALAPITAVLRRHARLALVAPG